jgi:hypothetical protein
LNGLIGVRQSVVLFFFAGGAGSEFEAALAVLGPDVDVDVAVELGDPEVDEFDEAEGAARCVGVDGLVRPVVEAAPELLRALTGDGKAVVSGPGLSGKAIVGNDTPVDGAPGVNCRLENPLVPVVFELELARDVFEPVRVEVDPDPDPLPD